MADKKIFSKVVKFKKLQKTGADKLAILMPKAWLEEMDWTRVTNLVLEYHPYKKEIVISENTEIDGEASDSPFHKEDIPEKYLVEDLDSDINELSEKAGEILDGEETREFVTV